MITRFPVRDNYCMEEIIIVWMSSTADSGLLDIRPRGASFEILLEGKANNN